VLCMALGLECPAVGCVSLHGCGVVGSLWSDVYMLGVAGVWVCQGSVGLGALT